MRLNLKKDGEKFLFILLFTIMAFYYGFRMFCLTPWYDELYTYYYFISNGPVYSAIHWPLPNNHVGYSVLSGFLNYTGNAYIGLRGISYLCALANMVLLYIIAGKFLSKWLPFITVILYTSMNLVNQLAIQGRGYTLGITCYLFSFLCLTCICDKETVKKYHYIGFSAFLVLGLYTLTSDVYWVIPVCMTGGFYLLYKGLREKKQSGMGFFKTEGAGRLLRLITAALTAAVITTCLYMVIWLAIGSNLIVKDQDSIYFGMSHTGMILKAPFAAVKAGIDYMLSMPYIQSVERNGFFSRLYEWMLTLADYFYGGLAGGVIAIFGVSVPYLIIKVRASIKNRQEHGLLLYLFLLTGIVSIPIILIFQSTLPYYRVFTFAGVLLALAIACLVQEAVYKIRNWGLIAAALLISIVLFVKCFCFSDYNAQYSMREYNIQNALENAGISQNTQLCVTDCTQQYLIAFLYGIKCENRQIEGSDMVLLDKRMTDPYFKDMIWEFYHYYDTIPWEYIENEMKQVYENSEFILYRKVTEPYNGRLETR